MVFNIASAALVYQSYQENSTTAVVTYTEYALSLTELIFVCINILGLIMLIEKSAPVILSYTLLIVQGFNIAYSAYIIEYYNGHPTVTPFLNNMALAIIILNSLALCGCCIGGHAVKDEDKDKRTTRGGGGGGGGGSWTLSQV